MTTSDWTIGGIDGEGEGDAPTDLDAKTFDRLRLRMLDAVDAAHDDLLNEDGIDDFDARDAIIRSALLRLHTHMMED